MKKKPVNLDHLQFYELNKKKKKRIIDYVNDFCAFGGVKISNVCYDLLKQLN